MNTRHQKPADIYAALRTVNWFVTGKRYQYKGTWDLVDRQMEKWMLQVLERRQYRRLKVLERNIRILGEHFERSAQAMCESVDRLNEPGSDLVITADMVRKLRDETDAPMMVCKKALTQAHSNLSDAKELIYMNKVK